MCHSRASRRVVQPPAALRMTTGVTHLPPAYDSLDPLPPSPTPAGRHLAPANLRTPEYDSEDSLPHIYGDNKQPVSEEKETVPSDLPAYLQPDTIPTHTRASTSPEPYGPAPAALIRSISEFAARHAWDKAPNGQPGQPKDGPLDLLFKAGQTAIATHQSRRSRGCCGHNRQRGCGRRSGCGTTPQHLCVDCQALADSTSLTAGTDTYQTDILQRDIQAFNAAMVDVRAGECCSKGAAKRAVRTLKQHLVEAKASKRAGNGKLDRAERKALKSDVKEVVREFKREIKEAWRAAP